MPAAAQKGKPPKQQISVPVIATFRCLTSEPLSPLCNAPVIDGTDRIRDDGRSYAGTIDPSGLFGAQLSTPVSRPETARLLNMYFGTSVTGSRTCEVVGNCHPNGASDNESFGLNNAQLRVKPLVPGTWEDLPGLMFGMACNVGYPALVHYTFWLPDGDGHWGFNFNPREYPSTTDALLTRLDHDTWSVEAGSAQSGELLSWAHSGIRGKNGPSHEGVFTMPFKVTIDATGPVPTSGVTCTP
jgi:hypothetical protein